MDTVKHADVDTLAAFTLGALEGETLREVEAHLASGCARCQDDLAWVQHTLAVGRADSLQAPPDPVRARALGISRTMRAGHPQAGDLPASMLSGVPERPSLWQRLRALPVFEAQGPVALPAGLRGGSNMPLQKLYRVDQLRLEITLQVQQSTEPGRLDLHGQVFSAGNAVSVAGLPVIPVTAAGELAPAFTSALGEFSASVPEKTDMLLFRTDGYDIEVMVPLS